MYYGSVNANASWLGPPETDPTRDDSEKVEGVEIPPQRNLEMAYTSVLMVLDDIGGETGSVSARKNAEPRFDGNWYRRKHRLLLEYECSIGLVAHGKSW